MNQKSILPSLLILSASLLVSPGRLFPQQVNSPGKLTREQKEEFLRTARIVRIRNIPVGVTHPRRATLTDGKITHDAHVQTVDIHKAVHETPTGKIIGFVDSYKSGSSSRGSETSLISRLSMVPTGLNPYN